MTTRDEALDACMRDSGWSRSECAEIVDDHMVGGAYCNGNVVLDEHGRRCIPDAALERRRAAIAADPLLAAGSPKPGPMAVPLALSLAWRALFSLADALDVK